MLTNRCSFNLSKILKEHGFPQVSIEFFSDYYDNLGNLNYNLESGFEEFIFAPYICEVIDRFDIDLDLHLSIRLLKNGFQYRIYDLNNNVEILSTLNKVKLSSEAYEQCILRAIEYYDQKKINNV